MKKKFFVPACAAIVLMGVACTGKQPVDQPVAGNDSVVKPDTVTKTEIAPETNADSVEVAVDSEPLTVPAPSFHYLNPRYGFSVDIPEEFIPQPEPENGDGRKFMSESGASIAVYAMFNALDATFDEYCNGRNEDTDTYRSKKDNWAVWSGYKADGSIYYEKVRLENDTYFYLDIAYPKDEKEKFDKLIPLLEKSWKTGLDRYYD